MYTISEEIKMIINDKINNLDVPDEFSQTEDGPDGDTEKFIDTLWETFRCDDILTGASKCVVLLHNQNFVLKIPFTGQQRWMQIKNFDEPKYDSNNFDFVFYPFNCARTKDHWDYCNDEVEIFKKAEAAGVSSFFARTDFYGYSKHNHPIYVQERCEVFGSVDVDDMYKNLSKEIKTSASEVSSVLPEEWIALAIKYFGQELTNKFLAFVEDEDIDDLHYENFGFIGDRPVLIDYSGYSD